MQSVVTCKEQAEHLASLSDKQFVHMLQHYSEELRRRWPAIGVMGDQRDFPALESFLEKKKIELTDPAS